MIRIGTRDSPLAMWQAKKVQKLLDELDLENSLVFIKSKGDINLEAPLNQLGTVGVFTKALDDALKNSEIDIAVHSCKDLPTEEPGGIRYAAYLERASHQDILVCKKHEFDIPHGEVTIATGSIRRKAQWNYQFPNHKIVNLRGNVNTRLEKLNSNPWFGAIFAKAGLERLEFENLNIIDLDWMIPAPAQGVICITCRSNDQFLIEKLISISDVESEMTSLVERQFLNKLEGGCSAPIGALAKINNSEIHLEGVLLDLDGKSRLYREATVSIDEWQFLGRKLADEILQDGGDEIIRDLKKQL